MKKNKKMVNLEYRNKKHIYKKKQNINKEIKKGK
jgi:hypothetical protein